VRGEFAAFTQMESADLSVLGRDVTNNFSVIYDYSSRTVVLLARPHFYESSRIDVNKSLIINHLHANSDSTFQSFTFNTARTHPAESQHVQLSSCASCFFLFLQQFAFARDVAA